MFNKALAMGLIIGNPCGEAKPFKIPQKQPLFFTELEIDMLLSKVPSEDLKDLIIFAIQTGLRQMELLTLDWNQINFMGRYLILDNRQHLTKSKKVRTVPLTIKALQVLSKRQLRNSIGLIFTYKNKPITQSFITHKFKEYVLVAELNPKLNFHSLRHTFASLLVQKGVSIFQVSKLLGHSSVNVTEIYSHLRAEDLRSAIDKLNN
jgi:integrase